MLKSTLRLSRRIRTASSCAYTWTRTNSRISSRPRAAWPNATRLWTRPGRVRLRIWRQTRSNAFRLRVPRTASHPPPPPRCARTTKRTNGGGACAGRSPASRGPCCGAARGGARASITRTTTDCVPSARRRPEWRTESSLSTSTKWCAKTQIWCAPRAWACVFRRCWSCPSSEKRTSSRKTKFKVSCEESTSSKRSGRSTRSSFGLVVSAPSSPMFWIVSPVNPLPKLTLNVSSYNPESVQGHVLR